MLQNGKRCVYTTKKENSYIHRRPLIVNTSQHIRTHTRTHNRHARSALAGLWVALGCGPAPSHLSFPLLQQRLQPLLGGAALVVIADDQDDVIPAELTHHVKPHVCLVGVGRDRP